MLDPDSVGMAEAAAAAGASYEHFRKTWRIWANPRSPHYVGFPQPYLQPPGGGRGLIRWRASAIAEWKRLRERALGAERMRPPNPYEAAGDPSTPRHDPRLQQERAALARLMERA